MTIEIRAPEVVIGSAMTSGGGGENVEGRMSRKEKRKMLKKMKRKEKRKEEAVKEKEEEEMRMNDPEEVRRMEELEREERERVEREMREFEERERLWMEEMKRREEERMREMEELEKDQQDENHDSDFEYVEEGPAEIIWEGNEIIVKKKKVKVPKKKEDGTRKEEAERPTSNPLPPQSEVYIDSLNAPVLSAQQAYDNLAEQVPSFGTEQDKAHCPFHIKTGVCRFGSRCNRTHFYPDKSCTLLLKNMYSGPGLAWEQDEGLESTDEEVERSYDEFYEDVHTEFLKFGEIINFKVCRNGSAHLRGNVYVHYKSLDSALLAYRSISGRYFAGKQVKCEFVVVTRWKVAICGEYMRTRFNTCSRGTACNFIHCFRNPGGDYEWADWDKPPPKYWIKKMSALFGYTDEYEERRSPSQFRDTKSQKSLTPDADRYHHSRRSRSKDRDSSNFWSHRDRYEKDDPRDDTQRHRHTNEGRRHVGRKKSKDTPDRDRSDTGRLKDNNREHSFSRRSLERQNRDELFIVSRGDEVDTNRDRSREEPCGETHGSGTSNQSRHDEVDVTRHYSGKVSRMPDSEGESHENGGSALDQSKDSHRYYSDRSRRRSKHKDKIRSTNWKKDREETEDFVGDKDDQQHRDGVGERLTHKHQEENRDGRKRKDKDRFSRLLRDRDRDVYKHGEGEENGEKHKKKRGRRSEHVKESYGYSYDHADKKKKTNFSESSDNYSDVNGQHQPNSPSNPKKEAVGIIDDRWVPE